MADIIALREEIDRIDAEMQRLFEARMDVAARIGEYKASRGMPVFDGARELAKINEMRGRASSEMLADDIEALYRAVFEISRARQEKILRNA